MKMVYHVPQACDFSSFLTSAELSDISIQYEHGLIPVHKIILAQSSEYFKTMTTGRFVEAGQRIIELKDDPPDAIRGMIGWIYGLQYKPQPQGYYKDVYYVSSNEAGLKFVKYQVDLYFTAEKYLMPRLVTSINTCFLDMLMGLAKGNVGLLHEVAKHVYITHADEATDLRKHVARAYVEKMQVVNQREDFKELLLDLPELAYDIIKMQASMSRHVTMPPR